MFGDEHSTSNHWAVRVFSLNATGNCMIPLIYNRMNFYIYYRKLFFLIDIPSNFKNEPMHRIVSKAF